MEGYLTPTESGSYDFFLRSDGASQLFISTDATEANLTLQAQETGCCDNYKEPGAEETTAAPLELVAGQRYFIRVVYKEGGGGDYAQVAWRRTTDRTPADLLRPIPGKYLSAAVDLPAPAEGAYLTQTPAPNAADVLPDTAITIVHRDGQTPWTASNVTLELDGVAVTSTFTKEANVATIAYQPAALFPSQTTHTITIGHPDPAGQPAITEWTFSVTESPVVLNLNDSGAGSLRQAIALAAPGETIMFGAGVAGTIALTSGELAFGKSLTIVGPTAAGVTISGNQVSRVFRIYGGVVNLANLTIANGNTASYGAGFFNAPGATLILNNCTVSGNTSADSGGGIANNGSVLATNCTFSGNRALQGGGIYTYAGPVLLRNCTVCSNTATSTGGGLYNYGTAGSAFTAGSTVVARNMAAVAPDVISNPSIPFTSLGYKLIGNGNSGYGFADAANGDQVGSGAPSLNPLLGPLQANGGPTFSHALLSGSPASDRGHSGGSSADQRGRLRPFDFGSVANAGGGDGSDIGAFELQPAPLFLMGPVKSGADLVVRFSSDLGQRYRIERKATLAPGDWTAVADNLSGTGGIVSVTDPGAASQPRRFYRGQVLP
jgi:hypothetical protein